MNTKEKIIRTSIALFNLHGERAITTNHIASNLGISPGNLYYHFKNKEDIIRNIFNLYREHLSTHFKPLDTSHEPLEQLTQYLDSLFRKETNSSSSFFFFELIDRKLNRNAEQFYRNSVNANTQTQPILLLRVATFL